MNGEIDKSSEWLLEEYKIIQAKIDKLGEDRFKVRSWCVTLVSGLLIAAKLSTLSLIPTSLFSLLTVFLFHLVEHRQQEFGRKLGARARDIEISLKKMAFRGMEKELRALKYVPRIAHTMIYESIRENNLKWRLRRPKSTGDQECRKDNISLWGWLVIRADNIFYFGQYTALIIVFVYSSIAWIAQGNRSEENKQITNSYIQITNTLLFSFPTNFISKSSSTVTNLVATNFIQTNMWTTNYIVTNVLTTNYILPSEEKPSKHNPTNATNKL